MRLHTELFDPRPSGPGTATVAILHGGSADLGLFADLIEGLLARGETVLGVDLRGHGRSSRAERYALADFAADVVETLPVGLGVVMGHSLGALVLLETVSALEPRRAVYLDPPFLSLPPELLEAARASIDDDAMHAGLGMHPDGSPYSTEELTAANPGWGPANIARAQRAHAAWDSSMIRVVADIVFEPRDPAGASPAVPSLVIHGGASPFLPVSPVDELAAVGFEVRIQAGAGHNLHLDDVDGTLAALDGWIGA